ncbi:MAG: tyrosine-type recombinase/integrase, partial [Chloroflexota bacterium]|nr:tyrosine-type recombinase/integrase [Chloroflexota bacterium]
LRGIAREAYHLGQLTAEDYERIKGLKPARGERLPAGRSASRGELAALLLACAADLGPAGVRDGALLALLYAGGLRRAEAAALDLADYDPGEGAVRVRGKGNKERRVYLTGGVTAALTDWLATRGPAPGPLFRPVNKARRVVPRRLSAQAIYAILQKRAGEVGLAHLSPHDLRRTFVGDLLDAGADLSTVQGMAGHANIATTARYDRRGDVARKRAAGLLHVPYVRHRGAR